MGSRPDAPMAPADESAGMTTQTAQFHDQHDGLTERVELLAEVARELPFLGRQARVARVEKALEFLHQAVVPHTWLDERVLYPSVAERLRDPFATATMGYDHVAIRGLIDDLGAADPTTSPSSSAFCTDCTR